MGTPLQPDDRREWSSIDIFIFCNGQGNAPPRKYHLQAEELSMWDSTLRHLATLHYGSKQSKVDMYTLDGKFISGPLELEHGETYVAVAQPDEFIQTDYHTYLMEASRSWQKRQKQRLHENKESLQDNSGAETRVNNNGKSKSAFRNFIEIENNKIAEKELSSLEYNTNMKSKSNPRQRGSTNVNRKQNNQPIIKNYRSMGKEENTKHNAIKKSYTSFGRNAKNVKQNILPSLRSTKGTLKTKIPSKSISNDNRKTDEGMINLQSRKDSNKLTLENLVGKLKRENITDSDFRFSPSLKVILSNDFAIESPNRTYMRPINTQYASNLTNHTTPEKDTEHNHQIDTKNIAIKRGGIINFRLCIRVNDKEVSNDRDNDLKLKIIPSNSSLVTEKASQVNIEFDINVTTLNTLHAKEPNENDAKNVFNSITNRNNDQICDSNKSLMKQNNENKLYILPEEKDDDQFKSCKCDEIFFSEQMRPDIVSLKSVSKAIDTASLSTEHNSEVDPREVIEPAIRKESEQKELHRNTIVYHKCTQTEWSDTLLEARRHHDGHYSLHLPTLAMLKNILAA